MLFRYIRLALPRSNARKWKFRLKTFREVNEILKKLLIYALSFFSSLVKTSQLGYEHVIEWINSHAVRPASESEVLSKDEPLDDEDELDDADRIETSGDIVSVPEMDEQQQIEQV